MSGPDPSMAQVILAGIASAIGDIWTSTQATVITYDAAKMRADLQPVAPDKKVRADGTYANEVLPVLADVPILFPGGHGFSFRWELDPGTEVLVILTKQSLRAWYDTGQAGVDPIDVRNHHLAHAIAIPILGRVAPSVDPDRAVVLECSLVKLGDPSTAAFAALAPKVDTAIANVAAALTDPATWAPIAVTGTTAAQIVTALALAPAAIVAALTAAWTPTLPGPPGAHPIDPTPCAKVKIS